MEDQHDQHQPNRTRTLGVARAVLVAGALPAVVYGAAVGRLAGAIAGLVLWLIAWGAAILGRRYLDRRRATAQRRRVDAASTPPNPDRPGGIPRLRRSIRTSTENPEDHRELFDQLTMEPCDRCGTATLLGTCLDCTAIEQRRRRVDGGARDDTDDLGD